MMVSFAVLLLPAVSAAEKGGRPNLLFIITDDHAVQAMGTCEKDALIPMPGFKRMADEGMVFDRAYCANSICGPSRACMMTGRHSHNNGFLSNSGAAFNGHQPTWPQMLRKAGYQTAVLGKWHLMSDPVGFDHWQVFINQGEYFNPNWRSPGPGGKVSVHRENGYATDLITKKAIKWMDEREKSRPFALIVGHKAPHRNWITAPRHLETIREEVAKLVPPETLFDDWKGRPEILRHHEQSISRHMCNWNDSHLMPEHIPFDVMKEIVSRDELREMINRGRFKGQVPRRFNIEKHKPRFCPRVRYGFNLNVIAQEHRPLYREFYTERTKKFVKDFRAGKFKSLRDMTVQRWRWYMEDYLGSLKAAAESVDELLTYLDNNGLSENTLVIYVGDQGFYLGEHNMFDKRWIFEESMRMPLIMRWKGHIPAGTRSQAMVQNIDYAPTILEVSGTDSPENMRTFDGESLVPLFRTGEHPDFDNRPLYYCFYENPGEHNAPRHDGIRTRRYTFARIWTPTPSEQKAGRRKPSNEWLLIDNEKDPHQMRNVAQNRAYAKVFSQLKSAYETVRKKYRVPDNCPGHGGKLPAFVPSWGPGPQDRMNN